jgi:hypothetical protein
LSVFHRQSIGFLYKRPLGFPSGPIASLLCKYIRVKAVSEYFEINHHPLTVFSKETYLQVA